MTLSRIWSSFIIIAILSAGLLAIFSPSQKAVFSNMVTGKSGDTIKIKTISISDPFIDTAKVEKTQSILGDGEKLIQVGDNKQMVYRIQSADGIIETCQTAVTLCLKLIGFLALFMGFLSIAEKAGGIRFLSRIIGPFFSKIFPEIPKGHPAMGHMVMNFSANLLGLDNAATPFGIKAMESLQEIHQVPTVHRTYKGHRNRIRNCGDF